MLLLQLWVPDPFTVQWIRRLFMDQFFFLFSFQTCKKREANYCSWHDHKTLLLLLLLGTKKLGLIFRRAITSVPPFYFAVPEKKERKEKASGDQVPRERAGESLRRGHGREEGKKRGIYSQTVFCRIFLSLVCWTFLGGKDHVTVAWVSCPSIVMNASSLELQIF